MDRPQHTLQQPGQRDMVYCHECENEWYRDEHGLVCPDCSSEFTEIIEEDHDPRGDLLLAHDHDHDSDSSHDGMDVDSNEHGTWANVPDPDEGNINEFHWQTSGPGRFSVHGTFYRTISPNLLNRDSNNTPREGSAGVNSEGIQQNFMTMLQGILGTNRPSNRPPGLGELQGNREQSGQTQDNNSGPQVRVIHGHGGPGRFSYTTTRLFPRDGNAFTHAEPVDDLNALLGAMFGPDSLGEPQNRHGQQQPGGGPPPFSPLAALFGHLMNPGGVHGDVVYSQEALDRVISQLMEQNASGNAPGPAPPEAISSLPKRKITMEDLGSDGKAECSICMDEVEVGEEVTVLPCTHWFHKQCVSVWLGEHDTCPHCRQSISSKQGQSTGQPGARRSSNSQPGPSSNRFTSPSHNYQPPGAFSSGSPGPHDPLSPSDTRPGHERSRSNEQNSSGNGGGITGRLRGLFGGGSNNGSQG